MRWKALGIGLMYLILMFFINGLVGYLVTEVSLWFLLLLLIVAPIDFFATAILFAMDDCGYLD